MEEAKTLLHHALSALFAVLILTAVVALISLGNLMWSAFSKQADANRRLREYSKYSAFDGTEVRGQDLLSLLHDTQGSPFIIFTDPNGGFVNIVVTSVDSNINLKTDVSASNLPSVVEPVLNSTVAGLVNDAEAAHSYNGDIFTANDDAVKGFLSYDKPSVVNFGASVTFDYAELQEWFLGRGSVIGHEPGYLAYDSYILYDNDSTTDIVGIIAVERIEGGA